MYNINMYNYQQKPFAQNGPFTIFPLDNSGLHKYLIEKDSHAKAYLNKLDPRVFKEIVGMSYHEYVHSKDISQDYTVQPSSKTIEFDNAGSSTDEFKHFSTIETPLIRYPETVKHRDNYRGNPGSIDKTNQIKQMNNNYGVQDKQLNNKETNQTQRKWVLNHFNLTKRKMGNKTNTQSHVLTGSDLLLTRITRAKLNAHHHHPQSHPYVKSTAKKTFLHGNFSMNNIPRLDSTPFTSTDYSVLKQSPFNNYRKKLVQSVQYDADETDEDIIARENNQMKRFITEQTDHEYLKTTKLPDINKVTETTKKVIHNISPEKTKFMSERYNPLAFFFGHKEHKKRNIFGAKHEY